MELFFQSFTQNNNKVTLVTYFSLVWSKVIGHNDISLCHYSLPIHFDDLGAYSQHFIFCVTCEWLQKARVFVPDNNFQSTVM
jgi:hypothetical protein